MTRTSQRRKTLAAGRNPAFRLCRRSLNSSCAAKRTASCANQPCRQKNTSSAASRPFPAALMRRFALREGTQEAEKISSKQGAHVENRGLNGISEKMALRSRRNRRESECRFPHASCGAGCMANRVAGQNRLKSPRAAARTYLQELWGERDERDERADWGNTPSREREIEFPFLCACPQQSGKERTVP